MQKLPGSVFGGACKVEEGAAAEEFPAGLRVLVVDDDTSCLRILEQMLRKCRYHVTTCCRASFALSLLRERKGGFDLVISDVHMPDMDGFKLLELVGLEMDLPVIMMSADGRTSAVMRGIRHGACDYLIKPVRMEELKNIWQHVVRKKWNGNKEHEHSGSLDDSDRQRGGCEEDDYASSVNDGNDNNWKGQKKKREVKEDEEEGDLENDDSSAAKKPRVVWSVELHQQFVGAVNQLGIDKAVPKRILELMNVPGLTRENVASHLQKFRLYLKRLSGVAQQQGGISNVYGGPMEANPKASALGRLDFQAMSASVHIPSHAMTAFHAEMLGRSSGAMVLPELDQPSLMHSSGRYLPPERGIAYGQPLGKCQSGLPKLFPQTNMVLGDMSPGFASWSPNVLSSSCPTSSHSMSVNLSTGNIMMQQIPPEQQSQSVLSDSSNTINLQQEAHTINVQPSCLISPSRSSDDFNAVNNIDNTSSLAIPSLSSVETFQAGSASVPVIQNSGVNAGIPATDYGLLSPSLSSLSQDIGKVPDGDYKSITMLNGYSLPSSVLPVSSSFSCSEDASSWKLQNPSANFMYAPSGSLAGRGIGTGDIQNSLVTKGIVVEHGHTKNSGYVGKVVSIPSRFAVDDLDSPGDILMRSFRDDGGRGRQEIHLEFVEGSKLENATMAHSSSSDLMSILSK